MEEPTPAPPSEGVITASAAGHEPPSPSPAPALSYATPPSTARPSLTAAAVLAAPGTVCWLGLAWLLLSFLAPSFMRTFGRSLMQMAGPGIASKLLVCWGVAIVAALVSLALYVRQRPKPWYVRLNLVVNVAGLLFTVGVLVLLAVLN